MREEPEIFMELLLGRLRGIGQAMAERLDREGAAAAVNYGRSADKAKAVVEAVAMTNQVLAIVRHHHVAA